MFWTQDHGCATANSQNAAKVGVNLNLGLEVGLNLKVIEPPQSAIGDPVKTGSKPRHPRSIW
jgi:hypothetical protein